MKKLNIISIIIGISLVTIMFAGCVDTESDDEDIEIPFDFPSKYFIPINEIPNGYEIETGGKNEAYESDVTFGPNENMISWYFVTYINNDTLGMISLNVLFFESGSDKTENIEEIEEIKEDFINNNVGYGPEYFVDGDNIIILLPLGLGVTEEDITSFLNKLK